MTIRLSRTALAALAIAASPVAANCAAAQEASRLSISATGYAQRVPDRATVSFNVSIEPQKTPPEAIDALAAPVKDLLGRLAAKGITGKNVRTSALSLAAKYEVKHEGGREIRGELLGYVAGKSVQATIEDVAQVQSFIREFPLVGRTAISDISFYSSESETAQSEALTDAIRRAQDAAARAAAAAGRKLGQVNSIQLTVAADALKQTNSYGRDYSTGAYGARLSVEPGEDQFSQGAELQWALQ
jgi:uncharacterized protein